MPPTEEVPDDAVNVAAAALHMTRAEYLDALDAAAVWTPGDRAKLRAVVAGEQGPTRIGLRPVEDLLAKQIPPLEWLVEGYIERGGLAAVVGPPNLGKTLLAIEWAVACAARGLRVAVLEEEGGERGLQVRLSRAIEAHGGMQAIRDAGGSITYALKPALSLMQQGDIAALANELTGYDLAVLDSLARMTPGLEENDSSEMGLIVAACDLIRTTSKCAIVLIHHTGKTAWKPGQPPSIGDGRGSGALAAGLDAIIALVAVPPSEQQSGWVSMRVHVTKQRDAELARPITVRIEMTGPCANVEVSEDEGATLEQRDELQLGIVALLRTLARPASRAEIERGVKGAKNRIADSLTSLLACGAAVEVPHGKYTKIALPPTSPNLPEPPPGEPPQTSPTSPPPVGGEGSGEPGSGRNERIGAGSQRHWQDGEDEP